MTFRSLNSSGPRDLENWLPWPETVHPLRYTDRTYLSSAFWGLANRAFSSLSHDGDFSTVVAALWNSLLCEVTFDPQFGYFGRHWRCSWWWRAGFHWPSFPVADSFIFLAVFYAAYYILAIVAVSVVFVATCEFFKIMFVNSLESFLWERQGRTFFTHTPTKLQLYK